VKFEFYSLVPANHFFSYGNSVVYGSSDENDDENDPCYNADYEEGRTGHSIKLSSDFIATGQEYHDGFISDRISLGEEIILLVIQSQKG
jgi:hypothetical protein